MRHLDLFSGIGGFALAARNHGLETVQFVEKDEYCQRVLKKNFPGVPIHDDVQTYTATAGSADLITAGWPCQDISDMGTREGLDGERSGLWSDVARLIGDVGPRLVLLENVAALLHRGLGDVLGDLATLGYDAEWNCIPAACVGAAHRRDRIWIVAYPNRERLRHERRRGESGSPTAESRDDGSEESLADTDSWRQQVIGISQYEQLQSEARRQPDRRGEGRRGNWPTYGADPGCQFLEGWQPKGPTHRSELRDHTEWWLAEPDVGRVADGVPDRVAALRALGNAIVPQVAEAILEVALRSIDETRSDPRR